MSELSESVVPKKNRKTSEVWNYFTRLENGSALCTICRKSFFYHTSTSNLKRHLEAKHKDHVNKEISKPFIIPANVITEDFEVGVEYEINENVEEEEQEVQSLSSVKKAPVKYRSSHNFVKPPQTKNLSSYRPNTNNNTDMIQEAINILSNVSRKSNNLENEGDEFSQFGKFVADQLRQLPALNALELQEKIYCFITRERISVMKNATDLHSYGLKSYVQQYQCSEQQEECTQQNNQQQSSSFSEPQLESEHLSSSPVAVIIESVNKKNQEVS